MGNLLFSPSGRIGPAALMKGITAIIVISLVLGILGAFVPALTMVAGLVGLVLLYCSFALWIKRYHDGGKTGWMSLIPIIVGGIIAAIISSVLAGMFVDPAAAAAIAEATESGDLGAIMKMAGSGGMTTTGVIIVNLVNAAITYVVSMLFNNMIKSEPNDNRFGPATIGDS